MAVAGGLRGGMALWLGGVLVGGCLVQVSLDKGGGRRQIFAQLCGGESHIDRRLSSMALHHVDWDGEKRVAR